MKRDGTRPKNGAALTHFDEGGNARMVDVGDKEITERVAVARATVTMQARRSN